MLVRIAYLAAATLCLAGAAVASGASAGQQGARIAFSTNRASDLWRNSDFSIRENGKGRRLVSRGAPGVEDVILSPDRTRALYIRGGELFVARVNGSNAKRLTPLTIQPSLDAAFSPDGRRIAFTGTDASCDEVCDYRIYVTRLDRRGLRLIARGMNPSWAPDGRRLAYSSPAASIYVVNLSTGRKQRLADGSAPVWAPRGDRIAYRPVAQGLALCFVKANGSNRRCAAGLQGSLYVAWSPDAARVAFSDRGLAVVDADGTHVRKLTDDIEDRPSAWSPDSRRIAYLHIERVPQYRFEIYTRNATGTGSIIQVTSEPSTTRFDNVRWKNDRIRYTALLDQNDYELAVMNPNGSGLRILTRNRADDLQPAFAPDRRTIVFSRMSTDPDGADRGSLRLIQADGTRDRALTTRGAWLDENPSWSPDGTRIAFVRRESRWTSPGQLLVLTLASGEVKTLVAQARIQPGRISWAPDGRSIVFSVSAQGDYCGRVACDLYLVDSDGTGFRRLTTGCYSAFSPTWSPDGRRILFAGACAASGLFVISPDGTGRAQIVQNEDQADGGSWSPDSSRIVFTKRGAYKIVSTRADGTGERVLTNDYSSNIDPAWSR